LGRDWRQPCLSGLRRPECYTYTARKIYKCKACKHQFSVTSGSIFADRKRPIRDYLLAIAIFANGANGHTALQLGRDLSMSYKCAFVLAHKLREALETEQAKSTTVNGPVAVDGAYFGGHIRPANRVADRVDRRLAKHQTGKRQVVVVARERDGNTITQVFKDRRPIVPAIMSRVHPEAAVYADEAAHRDALHARFLTKRINHQEAYSDDGVHTNQAESFFSRLRRAEIGTHHHISGQVPTRLRLGNGVARGQPEDQQRAPVSRHHSRVAHPSGEPRVGRLLAARGAEGMMGTTHVISALVAKRAELSGKVLDLDRQKAKLRSEIRHIDHALAIFGYRDPPR
jgi:transposase-like protein